MLDSVVWEDPWFLLLLLVIPVGAAWYWLSNVRQHPELGLSTGAFLQQVRKGFLVNFRHILFVLRLAALVFLILAMARPQTKSSWQNIKTEGIDIVIAQDVSGSMLALDFQPDRLEASKKLALEFISRRPGDRIGLVIFSGEAFTQVPLTTDHSMVRKLFMEVQNGMVKDGTAIGMGLATAVNRLKESKAISKVVILLTDGVHNSGQIGPLDAASLAKEFGIKVYTIGVGTRGKAKYPVQTVYGTIDYKMQDVEIDEESLKTIAESTGGKYYRAVDNEGLRKVYQEIDLLEKSEIDAVEFRRKTESFLLLAAMAAICFLAEFLLRNLLFKSIP